MKFIRNLIAAAVLALSRKPAEPEPTRTSEDAPTGRTWKKGPPPHRGWWNASRFRRNDTWRWWNGENWSVDVCDRMSTRTVAEAALTPAECSKAVTNCIEWTIYWPKNARVDHCLPRDNETPADCWPFPLREPSPFPLPAPLH